jgi:hypothetical protein
MTIIIIQWTNISSVPRFFTIFRLAMVSSVIDCIGNRNLRSWLSLVFAKLIMCVMFLSMSSCEYSDPVWRIVHFYIITFIVTFTFADFVDSSISNISSNEISSFESALWEPHGSTVPTECHHLGHFLLHCVFQWGTVKGILALACLNHWYTKSFSSPYLLPVSCLLRLDVVFSW